MEKLSLSPFWSPNMPPQRTQCLVLEYFPRNVLSIVKHKMYTNSFPLNKRKASHTHSSAPCFFHQQHRVRSLSNPPPPTTTSSFKIPDVRFLIFLPPTYLTVLIWSVDTRCLWAQSLKLVQLYLHTRSLKSLTNHVALDTVNIVPYLDHYTKLLIGLPGPPSLSPWSLFFTYLLELIS